MQTGIENFKYIIFKKIMRYNKKFILNFAQFIQTMQKSDFDN